MKIVTKKDHRRNQSVMINGITVKFDGNLQSEVTEKEFELIIQKDDSISKFVELPLKSLKSVDDKSKEKGLSEGEKKDEGKTDETKTDINPGDETKGQNANNDTGGNKTFIEELSGMKMGELKDVAKEANLPEAEWKGIKKKEDLITYLTSKVKE